MNAPSLQLLQLQIQEQVDPLAELRAQAEAASAAADDLRCMDKLDAHAKAEKLWFSLLCKMDSESPESIPVAEKATHHSRMAGHFRRQAIVRGDWK